VNAPYEPPDSPEVHIRSDQESVDDAATRVLARLEDLELIRRVDDEAKAREEIRKRLAALGYL